MRPVGVCLTNTRRSGSYALAARVSSGREASTTSCPEHQNSSLRRRFFATSNPVTAAFSGTLGSGRKKLKIFRIFTSTLPTPAEAPFQPLLETGNGSVFGNFSGFFEFF